MSRQVLCWLFAIVSFPALAQTVISGKITDEEGGALLGASVVINHKGTDHIIAYRISDSEGNYKISFSSNETELDIQVRSLGFKTVTKTILNASLNLDFKLESDTTLLKEISVKALSSIKKEGDTLRYQVEDFAKTQDRSIADALQRMPGIEVLTNGQVLYQGKPINKYYIEGLDLLGGKYNLANENLPHREVSEIQVLENHQPIQILDSLVFSDQAALNIKLKNNSTFTGRAEVGSGASPLLWDVNISPMLFTKKRQALVSYQTNNSGANVASQVKTLTIENLREQQENSSEPIDWLGISQLSTPQFPEKRWLENNIHLLSGNHLQQLKNKYELRINTSYLNDHQRQEGFTSTLFFTPTDTVALLEEQNNQLNFNRLETSLTLQKNTNETYLKNSLKFEGAWDSQIGSLRADESLVTQDLANRHYRLFNTLNTVFFLGNQLLTLYSYVGSSKSPQALRINPGPFEDLLNNGIPYDKVAQGLTLETIHLNNSVSFTKALKGFSFSPELGLRSERQQLTTQITLDENQTLPNGFANDLDWASTQLYADVKSQFKRKQWRIELKSPVRFHRYRIEDTTLQEREAIDRLTVEPHLSVGFEASPFWRLTTSAGLRNRFGAINQMYYGYILRNYRDIQRINAPLPQLADRTFSGGISYRNPLKSIFWNVIYNYTYSENNLLYQTQLLTNGATELQAIEQPNNRINSPVNTRLSKYFGELDTNVTLSASFGLQEFQQILNDQTTTIENQNWRVWGKIETDFTDWFNTEYRADGTFASNQIQNQTNSTIVQQSHSLNLNFYPKEGHYFALQTEYIQNTLFSQNTENFFADVIYRLTLEKKNIDLELQWNNIFDSRNYRTTNINSFSYVETHFLLRPSQVLMKVKVSL